MLTHGNWVNALDTERKALRLRPDDVYLAIYSMGHVLGIIHAPVQVGHVS